DHPVAGLPVVVDGGQRAVDVLCALVHPSDHPTFPRSAFLSDVACLLASILCLARRERRRFCRRTFSAACCRLLAAPRSRSSIFSASICRATRRLAPCVRSRWHFTAIPVGRCTSTTQVAT